MHPAYAKLRVQVRAGNVQTLKDGEKIPPMNTKWQILDKVKTPKNERSANSARNRGASGKVKNSSTSMGVR